ncbi:hypothetical protein D3C87_1422790 [compost metagenome]
MGLRVPREALDPDRRWQQRPPDQPIHDRTRPASGTPIRRRHVVDDERAVAVHRDRLVGLDGVRGRQAAIHLDLSRQAVGEAGGNLVAPERQQAHAREAVGDDHEFVGIGAEAHQRRRAARA